MLTNIFYYGYYKPYIVKDTNNTKAIKRTKAKTEIAKSSSAKSGNSPYSYLLNKALKKDLVSFATDISSNLNSIKDTARFIVNRYTKKNVASEEEKNNFADGLEDFANEVNSFSAFYENSSKESTALAGFDSVLSGRLNSKRDSLEKLGLSIDEGGQLSFNRDKFDSIADENYIDSIFECAELFDSVYNDTCEVMQLPLSEHMNFKNLNYYYNYTYAPKDKNSFKFIETGLLVDIKL